LSAHPIVAGKRDLPVTELAAQLRVSVSLLSRHLAVLRGADIVQEHRAGRQRIYSLRPEPLQELYDWASLFSDFWTERIEGLRAYLDSSAGGELHSEHDPTADRRGQTDAP